MILSLFCWCDVAAEMMIGTVMWVARAAAKDLCTDVRVATCRYCPSIEDKIVRFADKESHQIFLEPEGRNTPELYVQVSEPTPFTAVHDYDALLWLLLQLLVMLPEASAMGT